MKNKRVKTWVGICILVVVVVAVLAAIFFKSKPMMKAENSPAILSIGIEREEDGKMSTYDLSESEISDELANKIVSVLMDAKIRKALSAPPQTYEVSEGSMHITVRVALKNAETSSMFVNLCSSSQYNSAQFGDTHYRIINAQQVYEDVSRLLSEELFSK